jgi:hypothetical protein
MSKEKFIRAARRNELRKEFDRLFRLYSRNKIADIQLSAVEHEPCPEVCKDCSKSPCICDSNKDNNPEEKPVKKRGRTKKSE